MPDPRAIPPENDELEVSVFGPGKGECIVVHVPNGPWFVVDSLQLKKTPVAVGYLKETLKVDDLYGLFVTHWHSDHTSGAAETLEAFAPRVSLVGLPHGWGKRELASLAADLTTMSTAAASGRPIRELLRILSTLKSPQCAGIEVVSLAVRVDLSPPNASWRLTALSPSFADQRQLANTLTQYLPGYNGPAPKAFDPNSGCAVLRLEASGFSVMLCSDLDIGHTPEHGWNAIVKHHSTLLPSNVVKVGHHGSHTAHHVDAWTSFGSCAHPDGVVTPFPSPGGRLPRAEMIAKIKPLTHRLFLTAGGQSAGKVGNLPAKSSPFASYVVLNKSLAAAGQVRFRMKAGETRPRVQVFGNAKQL